MRPGSACRMILNVQTNLAGWPNEAYHRLVEEARRVTDQAERIKLSARQFEDHHGAIVGSRLYV
jgi:hypothetical protein